MKRYVRSANRFTNKATQFIAKAYTPKMIEKRSQGSHRGESMMQVFNNILHDPNTEFGDPDKNGNQVIYYNGDNIGWINFNTMMGNIDQSGYDKLAKYVEPVEDEIYDDSDYCEDGECY